jgi:arginyl-tRNA synthetase
MIKQELLIVLEQILRELGIEQPRIMLEQPAKKEHGDYTTNIALIAAKSLQKQPFVLAGEIVQQLTARNVPFVAKIEAIKPGFINIAIKTEYLINQVTDLLKDEKNLALTSALAKKTILIEYAHPNTHKEMHIGHMRTLITGEAIARLMHVAGAQVFRANYQGDIGPHVAKAMYGVETLMTERGLTLAEVEAWSQTDKAHFLGEGYVRGNQDYDTAQEKIDGINNTLYACLENPNLITKDPAAKTQWERYRQTRQWSLDYYQEFYNRFSTTFDRLFFESEMVNRGKEIVIKHIGTVFAESEGAVVFPGEQYGCY